MWPFIFYDTPLELPDLLWYRRINLLMLLFLFILSFYLGLVYGFHCKQLLRSSAHTPVY